MTDPIQAISHITRPYENATKDPATGRTAVGIPVAVIPHDHDLIDLKPYFEAWRVRPERRTGTVHLLSESFISYVQRYVNKETTVLFARPLTCFGFSLGTYEITAIFNFHPAGPEDDMTGYGDFRAITISRDYKKIAADLNINCWVGEIT